MIVQFVGENRKQAIANHFSLDIEEEDAFFEYVESMGYSLTESDEIIESLHTMWKRNQSSFKETF